MTSSNIASIGSLPIDAKVIRLLGDENFSEQSIILMDPASVRDELAHHGGSGPYSKIILAKFEQRLAKLSEWVAEGNVLIVILRQPTTFQFQSSAPPRGTILVSRRLFGVAPALQGIKFENTTGDLVEISSPLDLDDLLSPHLSDIRYETIVGSEDNFHPFLRVRRSTSGADEYVAAYRLYGKGQVLLIPPTKRADIRAKAYYEAVCRLPEILTPQPQELPPWVYQYRTKAEADAIDEIAVVENKISELQKSIVEKQSIVAEQKNLKALIGGTGTALQTAVANALSELGLRCVEGPHGRADLLATNGSTLIAVEIKGVEGSAKESDFRQVERWKAEANSVLALSPDDEPTDPDLINYKRKINELGVEKFSSRDCKGLLVVCTYRTTALQDRTESDFPDGVVRRLEQSNVCALSGVHLFGLVIACRSDQNLKHNVLSSLMTTAGILNTESAWPSFLTIAEG
jgi:hypothetical protein